MLGISARRLCLTVGQVILLPSALLQGGCAQLQAQARVDPQTIAYYNPGRIDPVLNPDGSVANRPAPPCPAKLAGDTNSGAINLDCFKFPEDQAIDGPTAYRRIVQVGHDAPSNDVRMVLRNRLAAILIKKSDDICTRELGDLIADEGIANTTLTTLDSFFSTAATIVTGEQAKSILSGLAGASNTGRTTLRAEVYRNALTPAIARAIINERDRVRPDILSNYKKSIVEYPVDQMIVDVNRYHQICSFFRGISLVNDAVDSQKNPPDTTSQVLELLDQRISTLEASLPNTSDKKAVTAEITSLRAERAKVVDDRIKKLTGADK